MEFIHLLKGGTTKSLGNSPQLLELIHDQKTFDQLFELLFSSDRVIVMRAVDVIEKVSKQYPEFLQKHKSELIGISQQARPIELKWHLALLVPRLELNSDEKGLVWDLLMHWACDKTESRIVRTHSVQSLHDLLQTTPELRRDFELAMNEIQQENIPSINARMRILKIISRTESIK